MSRLLIIVPVVVVSTLLVILLFLLRAQTKAGRPRVLEVSSAGREKNAQLSALIAEIRSKADAFVFLSGGASKCARTTSTSYWLCSRRSRSSRKAADGSRSAMAAPGPGLWKQRERHAAQAATLFR